MLISVHNMDRTPDLTVRLTSINLNLPKINGEFLAGLAFNTEKSLLQAKQLAVIVTESNNNQSTEKVKLSTDKSINATLIYLNHRLNVQNKTIAEKRLLIAGATVALRTGIIAFRSESDDGRSGAQCPDGEWFEEDAAVLKHEMASHDAVSFIEECIDQSKLQRAANVIIATKINWFKENHHIGATTEHSGLFARQAIAAMYGKASVKALISAANQLGRWTSTRSVLSQLGLSGCLPTTPVLEASAALKPTDDITRQLKSAPAGTERLALSYTFASMMLKHPIAILCPNIENFESLPQAYANVLRRPAFYHLKAKYLTGYREMYDDMEYAGFLGRVGAWANVFLPLYFQRMLMKSPHITSYINAEDYDVDFEMKCSTFKTVRKNAQFCDNQCRERLSSAFGNVAATYGCVYEAFGVKPNTEALAILNTIATSTAEIDEANE